ncbi:3-oxoacyl-ACP synthase [Aquimarina litoralis]|uniref:3-oxoacyl-ACP synthase n=1 Tax=Aquimarina litoralis TaxID=584605 RepID=UPI001C599F60|nr:3-oxoacyl-ACP synthase [Aquimarina litoralis]MBW1298965.1 3-oxoacyl-ACP synthase [Aquimarina litoralis]
MKKTKELLYHRCQQFVEDRLDRIQNRMSSIQESLTSETKSTAGDKHETGRAMLQLEREKTGVQLSEAKKLSEILSKVDIHSKSSVARLGSIVKTTTGNYFLSISVGEVIADDEIYFAIGIHTPIGKLLLGKTNGEHFHFNGKEIVIEHIY